MGVLVNFCSRCGTKLPPPEAPVDPAEKASRTADFANENSEGICGNKGHDIQGFFGAKYCAACGTALTFVRFSANPS
jgi:hypothetical protein